MSTVFSEIKFFNGCKVSVWDDGKVLEVENGDGCTTMNALSAPKLYI